MRLNDRDRVGLEIATGEKILWGGSQKSMSFIPLTRKKNGPSANVKTSPN